MELRRGIATFLSCLIVPSSGQSYLSYGFGADKTMIECIVRHKVKMAIKQSLSVWDAPFICSGRKFVRVD